MKILFIGGEVGHQGCRVAALRRCGHEVQTINADSFFAGSPLLYKLHWETGGLLAQKRVAKALIAQLQDVDWDLTWVDSGRLVGPTLIEFFKRKGPVLNYNNDDPLGNRDRFSWSLYRKSLPFYDLVVVLRDFNVAEAYSRGARKVMRVWFSADEVAHAPREVSAEDCEKWKSAVVFVGTWMPERGPFMKELLERGVPLSIFGERWHRAREWPAIKSAWRGPGTKNYDEYARVIQCSQIALGLLSKGNRDMHTQRSLEIPYLGGLFCAERTPEHLELYKENEEAVFWDTAEECAAICLELLADESKRCAIAAAGQKRCLQNQHFYEPVISKILEEVKKQ